VEYDIEYLPKAQVEYLEAYLWYEEQLAGLGSRFETAVERKLNRISKYPLLYPNKNKNLREATIDDFPFLIIYKVYPQNNVIFIYAIFHTSRRPGKKYGA
jgi:hypothetical protein